MGRKASGSSLQALLQPTLQEAFKRLGSTYQYWRKLCIAVGIVVRVDHGCAFSVKIGDLAIVLVVVVSLYTAPWM